MKIAGRTTTEFANEKLVTDRGWLLSFATKFSQWLWCHHSNECGMRVIQIGPLTLEKWS